MNSGFGLPREDSTCAGTCVALTLVVRLIVGPRARGRNWQPWMGTGYVLRRSTIFALASLHLSVTSLRHWVAVVRSSSKCHTQHARLSCTGAGTKKGKGK